MRARWSCNRERNSHAAFADHPAGHHTAGQPAREFESAPAAKHAAPRSAAVTTASEWPMTWDLSCADWRDRLRSGRSLVPTLPLDLVTGQTAVKVFNKLRLADVPGTPTRGEAGGEWFREIVCAMFGSLDANTRERMIRELFLLVPKKNSKCLSLQTPVATPTGWCQMGDIKVGDAVIAADGKPTVVTEKSPVFIGRDCYEVEFSTGEGRSEE